MIRTNDKRIHPYNQALILEGFALAGEAGKYYKACARHSGKGGFLDRHQNCPCLESTGAEARSRSICMGRQPHG